jgi:protein SCO1/2
MLKPMIKMGLATASHAQFRERALRLTWLAFLISGLVGILAPSGLQAGTTNYVVYGVVKEVKRDERQLVIAHDAIPNFMDAMTMPFNVKDAASLTTLAIGDKVTFQLHVTESESWIDHIEVLGGSSTVPALPKSDSGSVRGTNSAATGSSTNPLRNYKFTNELGQPVSLSDFRGQAIALTFFFTRCPIPEFCPRLSRNFQDVEHSMQAMPNAPTNWHLLSVTFDPIHDTPEALKAYGESYHYDPAHWSFLTGPKDKIEEFARLCDVTFQLDNGLFNHNFRTLIIDSSNHLQMVFPTSGNLSESIVQELLKATGGGSQSPRSPTNYVRSEKQKN